MSWSYSFHNWLFIPWSWSICSLPCLAFWSNVSKACHLTLQKRIVSIINISTKMRYGIVGIICSTTSSTNLGLPHLSGLFVVFSLQSIHYLIFFNTAISPKTRSWSISNIRNIRYSIRIVIGIVSAIFAANFPRVCLKCFWFLLLILRFVLIYFSLLRRCYV